MRSGRSTAARLSIVALVAGLGATAMLAAAPVVGRTAPASAASPG